MSSTDTNECLHPGAEQIFGPGIAPSHGTGAHFKGPTLNTVIVWLRRDLRCEDNPALYMASLVARHVIPVYIWSPEEEGQFQPGKQSRWWLHHSLKSLQGDLAKLGASLVMRQGTESFPVLEELIKETGASAVFFNHLYDPISLVRDNEVKVSLASLGVTARSFNGDLWYEPWEMLNDAGEPFVEFEAFWANIVKMEYPPAVPLPAPPLLPPPAAPVASLAAPPVASVQEIGSGGYLLTRWRPGRVGAEQQIKWFLTHKLRNFGHDRTKADRESTSRLSPYIHYGEMSVRKIFYAVREQEARWLAAGMDLAASCSDFLQQMAYREYSRYISFHFPFSHQRSLLEHLRSCPWNYDQRAFKAWRLGNTGYPLVDAGMRELWGTGWVHNRIRVVCASFLVKNLLLPWQWGIKHYWDALVDADLECDTLGWQYVAGCLQDARPFEHMVDLGVESQRFDPDGGYVRRWLPSLARLPTEWIHRPWAAPPEVLSEAGVELGENYPAPVVTLQESQMLVAHACSVINACAVQGHTAPRQPFRSASHLVGMPTMTQTVPWCEDDAFIGVVPPPMPGDEPSKRAPAEQTGSAQPPLPDTGARRYLHALRPARAHPEFSEGSLYKEMSYAPTIVSHMTLPGPSDSRPVTSSRAAEDPALARTRTQDRYGRAVSKRVKYNQSFPWSEADYLAALEEAEAEAAEEAAAAARPCASEDSEGADQELDYRDPAVRLRLRGQLQLQAARAGTLDSDPAPPSAGVQGQGYPFSAGVSGGREGESSGGQALWIGRTGTGTGTGTGTNVRMGSGSAGVDGAAEGRPADPAQEKRAAGAGAGAAAPGPLDMAMEEEE